DFAAQVAPPLAHLTVEKTWAGLRPATPDRLPLLGRLSEFSNVWIATGHFRAGLQLSTGTAVLMADAISGVEPKLSLEPFAPDRQSLRCEAL
ncbi:MAG: FAD-dependent oxidoreductase, partial [Lacipirellulaceae bacterium]